MNKRLAVVGALGLVVLALWPALRRRIPEFQVRLAGPLQVEDVFTHKRYTLTEAQGRQLAKALDFDGGIYGCGDEGTWRITAPNKAFVLTIGGGCRMDFNGWVKQHGGPNGSDVLLKQLLAVAETNETNR